MSEKVVLKVRNPRSELKIDEPHPLPPRLDTLAGKRIAVAGSFSPMTISNTPGRTVYLSAGKSAGIFFTMT